MTRRIKGIIVCLVCLCLLRPAAAEGSLWTEGTMTWRGHAIRVHAIISDALPAQLQQIELTGCAIRPDALFHALQQHFPLHPDFTPERSQTADGCFISMWAAGHSAAAGYDASLITNREVEQLFPIADPSLYALYGQCVAFLAELGITAAENGGYVCRQTQKGESCTVVLLPYAIGGLSTEYRNQIVHRDSLPHPGNPDRHIMDSPWADFVFDAQGRLVKAELAMLAIASAQPLSGDTISWQQAAGHVLDAVIAERISIRRTLEAQPDYDEAQFWQDYRVQLSRVTPMWMPNWSNVCLPGWCIQYQLYDADTGAFRYAAVFCADARTGEAACYHPR